MKKSKTNRIVSSNCVIGIRFYSKVLRMIVFLLLIGVNNLFTNETYSQSTKQSFPLSDNELGQLIEESELQSEYIGYCNDYQIDLQKRIDDFTDISENEHNQTVIESNLDINTIDQGQSINLMGTLFVDHEVEIFTQQPNQRVISGTVSDSHNNPLPGVTVVIKGSMRGVITDADGKFSLSDIPNDATLVFSYIGMRTLEVAVTNQSLINVRMEEVMIGIDELVVVGYGTQRKVDLTGSVTVVSVETAKERVTHDISQMLQGQVPGVSVQGSGQPGGEALIKIRGITSFGNNKPLFIIDGIPVDDLRDFSANDIESIQILKDASAGAIYGSRAAAGVVIITTKKGIEGPMQINYNGYFGWNEVPKRIPVTNAEQYRKITNAATLNAGLSLAPGNDPDNPLFVGDIDTDWQEEALKTGLVHNHNISFLGGKEELKYNVALSYYDQEGNYVGPQQYFRYNGSVNLSGEKNRFSYGVKMDYVKSHSDNPNGVGYGGSVASVLMALPTHPVYDENRLRGYGGIENAIQRSISLNVVGINNIVTDYTDRNRFLGNIWVGYEFVKNLRYKLNLSYDKLDNFNFRFNPTYDLGYSYQNTIASMTQRIAWNITKLMENTLSYEFTLKNNRISLLAGNAILSNNQNNYTASASGYVEPYYYTFEAVSDPTKKGISNVLNESKLLSYFGRINYNYDDRYLLTVNYRMDGSSRFSPSNRAGSFPSVAAAWNIHNEHFVSLPEFVSTLKLRGGYGKLGNQEISNYSYQSYINANASYPFGTVLSPGSTTVAIVDPDIKWEETTTYNAAIDITLFNGKFEFSSEYFNKTSSDILVNVPIPFSVGSLPSSYLTNAASIRNKGIEFIVGYKNSEHEFKYGINCNISTLNNEVLELGGANNPIYGVQTHGSISKTEVGGSVGELIGFKTEGVFQNIDDVNNHAFQPGAGPGDVKFVDINDDGLINANDRVYLGSAIPKLIYGLNFTANYKWFDISLVLNGHSGNKIYNEIYRTLNNGQYENHHIDVLNFWTPDNTDTNIPRPIIGNPNQNNRFSDRFVEDGSFVRLQNFQIGFRIPENFTSKIMVKSARIYFSAQNILTITKYKGYDPDFISDGLFNRGFDYGSFPNPKTLIFGLNVSL